MKLEMTEPQRRVLAKMSDGEWYATTDLQTTAPVFTSLMEFGYAEEKYVRGTPVRRCRISHRGLSALAELEGE